MTHGRHMMKMGGNILRQQMNVFYAGNNGRSGYMSFSGRFTAANAINPAGKLVGEADFVLGLPTDLGRGLSNGTWGHRKTIYGFYFQDDWRVTDSLTLNLGLRWEYHTPLVEVHDRQVELRPVQRAVGTCRHRTATAGRCTTPIRRTSSRASGLLIRPASWARSMVRSRGVHRLLVHGGHRHQPAPAVEPAARRRDHDAL